MAEIRFTGPAKVWVFPVGAEILGRDGDQIWYGTDDGLGSTGPIGGLAGPLVLGDGEAPS